MFVQRLLAALLCAAALAPAAAQDTWPTKPVKFIDNFPRGGRSDLIARALAEALSRQSGQPVDVENQPGARGNVGAAAVAKAAPDGSTVLFGIDATFTVNPHIYRRMPFRPTDLKPLMVVASSGLLVAVHPDTGLRSLKDVVAAGKARPLTFASAGTGSAGHLAAERLSEATGAHVTHVAYNANAAALSALLACDITGGVLPAPDLLPYVQAGRLTAVAVTSHERSQLAPQVPTVAEAGLPQLEHELLYLAMVPAATPEPVVQAMQKALAQALARPDVRSRFAALDLHPEAVVGAAAHRRLAHLSERYRTEARLTGLKLD
jgi:tripartite-type tricarboxylate transporter receptor subunit TctC